jgi:5-methylthioadenosine/S-adenosylhomocysteine deaminase
MDVWIANATVVCMDPERRVLAGADVVVRGGRIVSVGPPPGSFSGERVDAAGGVLLPGFVQPHVHLCQTLFRGRADGLPLLDWLSTRIWPLEAAHDEQSMDVSARLGIAELIRGGTTACLDMGTAHETDVLFAAARDTGFRLTGGKAHMDEGEALPPRLREDTEASLREAEALCRRWHGTENGRLRYAFAPRFVLSCSDRLLAEVGPLARSLGARLHTHASENAAECRAVHRRFGRGNLAVLADLGLAGPDAALAHCVHLEDGDLARLAVAGASAVHCPTSNLKLGSGIAPVPELLAAGINVGLAADGAACNDALDVFREMRLAALLPRPRLGPGAMPAERVLALATLGGARALGLETELGSIEVGKRADLVLLDLDRAHGLPGEDVYGRIVFAADRSDVRSVWIDGRPVLRDGRLLTVDEERLVREAPAEARRVAARAERRG